jgi:hypothetical protein
MKVLVFCSFWVGKFPRSTRLIFDSGGISTVCPTASVEPPRKVSRTRIIGERAKGINRSSRAGHGILKIRHAAS